MVIQYLSVLVVYFFPLPPLYCSFRLIRKTWNAHEHKRQDLAHEPITADHSHSHPIISRWRHCFLSCDFLPFFLNYPPPNPLHALGVLLKLNGLRGGNRDADPRCNSTCWSLLDSVIYTPFNVIFNNIYIVLFMYYKCFLSNILWRHWWKTNLNENDKCCLVNKLQKISTEKVLKEK